MASRTINAFLACTSLLLVAGCSSPIATIDAGKNYLCILRDNGKAECHNYDESRGPNAWVDDPDWPSLDTPSERLTSISTTYGHFCGLTHHGRLRCTGDRDFYEPVPEGAFVEVETSDYSTCALDEAGEATCWGLSFYEQGKDHYKGSDLEPPAGPYQHVYGHDNGYCGLRTDGTVTCWGTDFRDIASPPDGHFQRLLTDGGYANCGIPEQGEPVCWGWDQSAPLLQQFLRSNSGFRSAAFALDGACVLDAEGHAQCMSYPALDPSHYDPPAGVAFKQITAGYHFFCGLAQEPVDGHDVLCWGCPFDADTKGPGVCETIPW